MPERCEAQVSRKTLDHGEARIFYTLDGEKIDKGPGVVERPAREEAQITCDRCQLGTTLTVEGGAPYGAINEARRQVKEFIKMNCRKLRETDLSPEQMPKDWIQGF